MIKYSASVGGFFSSEIHKVFPEDCVDITEEDYTFLLEGQTIGKVITANKKGFPVLADQKVSKEDIIVYNNTKKESLLFSSSREISILKDAIDLNLAAEGDAEKLKAWREYRVNVSRIDTTSDSIIWPVSPS